jgi:hypothetical protein
MLKMYHQYVGKRKDPYGYYKYQLNIEFMDHLWIFRIHHPPYRSINGIQWVLKKSYGDLTVDQI